ncbi:albumin-2-like [Lotus japonicus]|uniref:albumin-2-like n=1 Tax=Lotus japonicus TaxID=34305 RepID=UPI00258B9F11|nr:albumin-2-like [Lotus japonicus]
MSPIPHVSINAAFRSSRHNEAYIFMNNLYVVLNYGPGSTTDKVLNGGRLLRISDGFLSLAGTPFGEHGIDCAFDTDRNEAYIFSGNLCAYIDYAPGTRGDDKILKGPLSISDIFPCLKSTVFEKGIDAAFRSTKSNKAYIFRGGHYGVLNYASNTVNIDTIRNSWYSLAGTVFESGIEAAFASHVPNRAYIFKGDHYAAINFVPGTHDGDDYMVGGDTRLISDYWPGIGGVLARKNGIRRA